MSPTSRSPTSRRPRRPADGGLTGSHGQRCLAAAWYLLPRQAALAGRSAAWRYGVRLIDEDDPVEVVTPWTARFGPVGGLRIHVADLPEDDIRMIDGVRWTGPVRTCWDLARWLGLADAVAHLDAMIGHGLTTAAVLRDYAQQRAGRHGWRKLERAVALTDPAARSVQESRLRVRLVLAGLPKPVSQHEIVHEGRVPVRVALAWPQYRVGVAYEGRSHTGPPPDPDPDPDRDRDLDLDRAGGDRLAADGWIVLSATPRRLREDFPGFVAQARSALRGRHQQYG